MISTKVESTNHMLYVAFTMFNDKTRMGSVEVDLSTIMNARGYNFKRALTGVTMEQAEKIVNRPIEYFKEHRNDSTKQG